MGLNRIKGFGLTEGLIGLAVLSSGLLAIYGVHTSYIKSFADDREKANMMSRLSSELTKAKSFSTCDALDVYAGSLTDMSMVAVSHNGDNTACDVTASGSWSTPISQGEVSISGIVFLRDLKLSSDDEFNEGDGGTGVGVAASPLGEAIYGEGEKITDGESYEDTNDFGLKVVKKDGTFYLLDNIDGNGDGDNLLEASNLFYRIRGRVYLDASSWDEVDFDRVYVGAPDTSVCRTLHPDTYSKYTYGSNDYFYTDYICYVGSGWYGSIGVTEVDQSGNGANQFLLLDADTCVGDPDANNIGSAYSLHATNSLTRRYTKYKKIENYSLSGGGQTLIKYSDEGFPVCSANDKEAYETSCIYTNQDFVISDSAACTTELNSIEDNYAASAALFSDTPGKYVCLDESDFCPYLITEPYAVSGAVTIEGLVSTQVSGAGLTGISGATMTFSSTDRVSVVDTSSCYATSGDTAYWKCDITPAVGEGFSSTWASYGVGDLTISNLPSDCTGDSSRSDQVVSGSSVTVPGIKFGSGRGQFVYLEGLGCAGTPGDTGTGTGTGNSCSLTLIPPGSYTKKNTSYVWTYTASNAENVVISISDDESDSSKKSSLSSTTGSPFTVNNAKGSGVEVTITLSGKEVGTPNSCTTVTKTFITTNN